MHTIYGMASSGNCHKVRMVLEHLRIPYEWREVDIMKGESRTPEFLALNPNGKVPAARLADGRTLAESNAMLVYFAEGSALPPDDAFARARALQGLFFEQYIHEPHVARGSRE